MRTPVPRRLVATFASLVLAVTLGLVTATLSAVSSPTPAHASSAIGGYISRYEVMARAADWYNRRYDSDMTYSMSSYTWDLEGSRKYRRDCSGFIDMAWHLGSDPNTQLLDDSTYTTSISRSDLKPGDLLDDTIDNDGGSYPYHAILFGGWENSSKTSFWYYSFGSTPLKRITGASFSDSYLAGHPTSQYKALRYRKITDSSTTTSVYGVLADGRMTYTAVDAATGDRTHGAVVSSATLGFTPRAMATLNFNTVLVTSTAGHLYRVDISTNRDSLVFYPPVDLGAGWSHRLLAYDGNGHLYGIYGDANTLRRYTITAAKPTASQIVDYTTIDTGFGLKALTATGPDWIIGNTSDGRLRSYKINGPGNWKGVDLKDSTWGAMTNLVSPGGGVYFGHRDDTDSLNRYLDRFPYDYSGSDLTGTGAVDSSGWTQMLLSAQPGTYA